jgi:hypothetical protein
MSKHSRRPTGNGSTVAGQETSPEPARAAAELSGRPRWVRAAINAFILWHLFALTIWLMPISSALRRSCVHLVHPYMVFTGFAQNWNMFSPNPSDLDLYWEARITYANGQVQNWNFPRMTDLGYVERYRRERFRKMIEFANPDGNRAVWPSLAKYAAQRNDTDPRNRPVAVELVRHFRIVPPPGGKFGPYQTFSILRTPISPEDLR